MSLNTQSKHGFELSLNAPRAALLLVQPFTCQLLPSDHDPVQNTDVSAVQLNAADADCLDTV